MIKVIFTQDFFENSDSDVLRMVIRHLLSYPSYSMFNHENGMVVCNIEEHEPHSDWIEKEGTFNFIKELDEDLDVDVISGTFTINSPKSKEVINIGNVVDSVAQRAEDWDFGQW